MTIDKNTRLQQAIAKAAEKLDRLANEPPRTGRPSSGDLFVFDTGEDAALEWLVVREHADDASLLLLAPVDDSVFTGPPDIDLHSLVDRPMIARCGEAFWAPLGFCQQRLRTGAVSTEALRLVRQKIGDLARGEMDVSTEQRRTEADPEYEDWMELVARARMRLEERAHQPAIEAGLVIPLARFTFRPPSELTGETQYSLAAESGSSLLSTLSDSLEAAIRYREIDVDKSGKLILQASEMGVSAIWVGIGVAKAPKLLGKSASGGTLEVSWKTGPEGRLQRADSILPWVDGRVVLTIATEPPMTITIER